MAPVRACTTLVNADGEVGVPPACLGLGAPSWVDGALAARHMSAAWAWAS